MSDDENPVLLGDVAPLMPDAVIERIVSCVRFVHSATGLELDASHETLPILDYYATSAREQTESRPETLPLLSEAMGAYFGQVLARELGLLWRANDPDPSTWLLYGQDVFVAINPIGVAYDVLCANSRHEGPSSELLLARDERELIAARLAALPDVAEDQFFTFASRFDVLHIVVEALRGLLLPGAGDMSYEWGDYEDELVRQGRLTH